MPSSISFPFLATAGLLIGALFLESLAARRIAEPLAAPLDQIDSHISGWTALTDHELAAPTLHALKPTAYLSRTYGKDLSQLELFIAFYAKQRAGESMHSPKHCLPGAGWEIWKHDSAFVQVGGKSVEINKYSIQNSGTRRLMFYWYQSRSRIFSSEYLGKILLARDTIVSGRTAGSIVRIDLPDVAGADKEGVAFASQLITEVQRCLGHDSNQNSSIGYSGDTRGDLISNVQFHSGTLPRTSDNQ
jgi:EpsI family protein